VRVNLATFASLQSACQTLSLEEPTTLPFSRSGSPGDHSCCPA
jgi:hypothetical protein